MVLLQSDPLRDFLIHWFNGHSELFKGVMCYIGPGVGTVLHNSDTGKGAVFLIFSSLF